MTGAGRERDVEQSGSRAVAGEGQGPAGNSVALVCRSCVCVFVEH